MGHPGPGSPETLAAIQDAVGAYTDSVLSGDAETAYGLLSAHCQQVVPLAEFAASLPDGTPTPVSGFDAQVEGGSASVSYTAGTLTADGEAWVREDQGQWRKDAC